MPYFDEVKTQVINWTLGNGAIFNEFISFKSSPLGGTGVFFDLDGYRKNIGESEDFETTIEAIRIPKKLVLSLDSINSDLNALQKDFDKDAKEDYINQSKIFSTFLENFSHAVSEPNSDPYVKSALNESNILVGEIQVLTALKVIREKLLARDSITTEYRRFLENSPFARIDPYLNLLQLTNVSSIKLDSYYEDFQHLFKNLVRKHKERVEDIRYKAVIDALDSIEDTDLDISVLCDTNFLRRVESTVISRVLEIPEPVKEIDENEYSFAVTSTLVPIVDFVNHNTTLTNSVFDADRQTGDVILKVKTDSLKEKKGEVELFISYDEDEDVLKFAHTYGFIPKGPSNQILFDFPIDRSFLLNERIDDGYSVGLLLRWLNLIGNVQLVASIDEKGNVKDVLINIDQNPIIFGFLKGLKYHEESEHTILQMLSRDINLKAENFGKLNDFYKSELYDVINAEGVSPFYYQNDPHSMVSLEALILDTEDDEIDRLIIRLIKIIERYFIERLVDLDQFLEKVAKNSFQGDSIVVEFVRFEREIIKTFQKQVKTFENEEDLLQLIMDESVVGSEWAKYRLPPRDFLLEAYLTFEGR